MVFNSLLYPSNDQGTNSAENIHQPDYFHDLNLDRLVAVITQGREEYHLESIFYHPENRHDVILYRQEIMKDICNHQTRETMKEFLANMASIRGIITRNGKRRNLYNQSRWHVEAIASYCQNIHAFTDELTKRRIKSDGLLSFITYLQSYIESEPFLRLYRGASKILSELSRLSYGLLIKDGRIEVFIDDDASDYSNEILQLCVNFTTDAQSENLKSPPIPNEINHI